MIITVMTLTPTISTPTLLFPTIRYVSVLLNGFQSGNAFLHLNIHMNIHHLMLHRHIGHRHPDFSGFLLFDWILHTEDGTSFCFTGILFDLNILIYYVKFLVEWSIRSLVWTIMVVSEIFPSFFSVILIVSEIAQSSFIVVIILFFVIIVVFLLFSVWGALSTSRISIFPLFLGVQDDWHISVLK